MKRNLLMLLACISMLCAWADEPFRNHRYDSFKALEPAEGSIVFIGNSITDMHCWPEVFKTSEGKYLPIVNRGNSGTYSTEQSNNLESYLGKNPKKVFMMIGTNDIATSGGLNFSPEQVLAYVKSMDTYSRSLATDQGVPVQHPEQQDRQPCGGYMAKGKPTDQGLCRCYRQGNLHRPLRQIGKCSKWRRLELR